MKVKTSVTLSKEMLAAIDRLAGSKQSRSSIIEQAVEEFVTSRRRQERYEREVELINKHAVELNREAEDVLSYQVEL